MTTAAALLERVLLGLLILCTIAALAGYASFALHPQWMGTSIGVMRAYAAAMTGFPRAHILLGFLAIAVVLTRVIGMRWVLAAVLLYVVSLGSELLGTSTGLPFGPYRYTEALGPEWFHHVPVLIPLSWCTMGIGAFVLARRRLGVSGRLTTVLVGSLLLVAWDLTLDPAMSRLTPYWVWGETGPYFGMPLLNLVGWYLTGVALMTILSTLAAERWIDALPPRTIGSVGLVYGANVAMPVGMTLFAGLAWAATASLGVLGVAFGIAVLKGVRLPRLLRRGARGVEVVR